MTVGSIFADNGLCWCCEKRPATVWLETDHWICIKCNAARLSEEDERDVEPAVMHPGDIEETGA